MMQEIVQSSFTSLTLEGGIRLSFRKVCSVL
jgi:hypothetical protein